jgi:hypothetical protein
LDQLTKIGAIMDYLNIIKYDTDEDSDDSNSQEDIPEDDWDIEPDNNIIEKSDTDDENKLTK